MSRHSILSPLSVLLAGLLVIVLVLTGGGAPSTASSAARPRHPYCYCEDDDPRSATRRTRAILAIRQPQLIAATPTRGQARQL